MDEYRCTCDDEARPRDGNGVKCLVCFWLLLRYAAGLSWPRKRLLAKALECEVT